MRSDWCNAVYTLDLECAVIGWMIVCGVNSQLLLARWTLTHPLPSIIPHSFKYAAMRMKTAGVLASCCFLFSSRHPLPFDMAN